MADFWVNGIVAVRDHQPYVQLSNENGIIAQLSMAQTQKIALDMLIMAARTEADAMIWQFWKENGLPENAGAAFMQSFRDFRARLDQERVESKMRDPDTGEIK